MPVKLEIISVFFIKKLGTFASGKISPFANYSSDGEREIYVLDCSKDNSTAIYKVNPELDEVDIEENGLDDKNFEKVRTLEKGEEFYLEASKNRYGQTRLVRFTQE